jgi:hypothetical protein
VKRVYREPIFWLCAATLALLVYRLVAAGLDALGVK